MRALITFIILACSINFTFGQEELIDLLNKKLIKVETISPDSSFSDLAELIPILNEKKIIGLGEATHGTHEFFVYKHRLIKLLIKHANFNVFIIEGDFAGSNTMNEYILDGKGTIDKALWDVGVGIWMRQEFVDLVEWMKSYNADKSLVNKIKFYGCDIQSPVSAAQKIKNYLDSKNLLDTSLKNGLDWILDRKYQKKLSKDDKNFIMLFLNNLETAFNNINNENSHEFEFIKHCKRELEQYFEYALADSRSQIILRDKFMAENIEWIYDFEKFSKSIVWAHNEHVKNDCLKGDDKPVGYYLKEKFKNGYYSFGFDFYEGKVRAFNPKNKEGGIFNVPPVTKIESTEAVFRQCIFPVFIIDLQSANNNKIISEFLKTKLYRRNIGSIYLKRNENRYFKESKLIDTFDGLIFFRNTSPSILINK